MDEQRLNQLLDDYRCGSRPLVWPKGEETCQQGENLQHGSAADRMPEIPGYEMIEEVARGGMGVVFAARDLELDRLVAIKMVAGGLLAGPERVARFAEEAKAVAQLDHPHIVKIFDVGQHHGDPYFAMELLEGQELRRLIDGITWTASRSAKLVMKVAQAAHAAHQAGIIHRDLKPANIIVRTATPDDDPRVIDFGLAKSADAATLTLSGEALGTPSYMAPEQVDAQHGQVGPATDVYALGAMLYELLTGKPPFQGSSVAQVAQQVANVPPVPPRLLNPDIPVDIETICLMCLRKSPEKRYHTAAALADDLGRFLEHRPVLARRVPLWERAVKWSRRHPGISLSIVASLLTLVVGSVAWVSFTARLAQQTKVALLASERANLNAAKAEDAAEIQAETMGFLNDMTYELITLDSEERLYEALQASEAKVAKRLEHRPLPMAAYLLAMGDTLGKIGRPDDGLRLIRQAKAVFIEFESPRSKNTTRARLREVQLLNESRNIEEAARLVAELVDADVDFFDQDRWSLRLTEANVAINGGAFEQAEQKLHEFIRLMMQESEPNQLQLLEAHQQLGVAMSHQGRFKEAGPHFAKRLEYAEANFPAGHEAILAAQNVYGVFLANTDRPEEAIEILASALQVSTARRGGNHKGTIEIAQNMAAALSAAKRYDEAKELLLRTVAYNLEHFGHANNYTLGALINLAVAFINLEQFAEGFQFLEANCDVAAIESMQSPFAGQLLSRYSHICLSAGEDERAGDILDALERVNRAFPTPNPDFTKQVAVGREKLLKNRAVPVLPLLR